MNHEHAPEEKNSHEIIDDAEIIEPSNLRDERKRMEDKSKIDKDLGMSKGKEIKKMLDEHGKEIKDDHKKESPSHDHDHGHGEETKKPLWKKVIGVSAVGGGLFTGLLGMFANSLWNTIRGKDGGGGGGGGHKSGGGGHGGGGHH